MAHEILWARATISIHEFIIVPIKTAILGVYRIHPYTLVRDTQQSYQVGCSSCIVADKIMM